MTAPPTAAALRPLARWLNLLRHFVVRDIQQRYLGSLWGGLWALLQPLLLFGIYAVVFVQILKVRLPATAGGDFVPFLVASLWPWTAFAEALNRSSNAIPEHASLLEGAGEAITIDLHTQQIRRAGHAPIAFAINAFARQCLLDGVDELGYLLARTDAITRFEGART